MLFKRTIFKKNAFAFLLAGMLITAAFHAVGQKKFSFFALGDMPYHNPEDIEKFRKLTDAINAEKSAFTVHVGDIKSGASVCSDEYFQMILDLFRRFRGPLIYTPGDNEWTDCDRTAAGSYDPVERLTALRKLYFRDDVSLGQRPLKLSSQRHTPGFEDFVENVLWRKSGITFATVHVVGSNNNFKAVGEVNEEFSKRDKANLEWLSAIFQNARNNKDAAVVIFMHGAMVYAKSETNGFSNVVERLRKEVTAFEKPVLLVYGDHHHFLVSKPLMDADNKLVRNFTALMVFGDADVAAVKISVDVKAKEVFSFSEFVTEY